MKICAGITQFYKEVPSVKVTFAAEGGIKKTFPLTRLQFNRGAALAILLTVQKIALSVLFLIGVIVTCGLKKDFQISLSKNFKEIFIYSGAIFIGYIGVLFPQTINKKILLIPPEGLITEYKLDFFQNWDFKKI